MPDDQMLHSPAPMTAAAPSAPLAGRVAVPGDKSISHRALMLGALAVGRTEITGLLEGEDVLATAAAMRLMGATIERAADGHWLVDGVGLGGLGEPADMLDLGNPNLDWVGLAKAMGVPGAKVTTMEEFNRRCAEGLATPGPYLVEVEF